MRAATRLPVVAELAESSDGVLTTHVPSYNPRALSPTRHRFAMPNFLVLLKPNSTTLAGSKLVTGWSVTSFAQPRNSLEPASNLLRTSFEPASVMESGREPASSC